MSAKPECRPIPGHPGYLAGSDGLIYSTHGPGAGSVRLDRKYPPRIKKGRIQNSGYFYVNLVVLKCGKRTGRRLSVHRLVALAWHGEPPKSDSCVRHLNGRKLDNRPENLRYGSARQNFADMIRLKHRSIKLTPKTVREIRLELMDGKSYSEIGVKYGTCSDNVRAIAEGLTWREYRYGLTPEFRNWQREHLPKTASQIAGRAKNSG